MKDWKYRLQKTLIIPIGFYIGYSEGIEFHIFHISGQTKARSLFGIGYDARGKHFCFDILFLGIYMP